MSKAAIATTIFLLAFALLIQNTCPKGFAGKSSLAAFCSRCPQEQAHRSAFEGATFSSIAKAPVHLPIYVLDIPSMQPAFRLSAISIPQPDITNTYKNTSPDELFQPPRA